MTKPEMLISQAYVELAEMRERFHLAEYKNLHGVAADLSQRIATSEARIRALEAAIRG